MKTTVGADEPRPFAAGGPVTSGLPYDITKDGGCWWPLPSPRPTASATIELSGDPVLVGLIQRAVHGMKARLS